MPATPRKKTERCLMAEETPRPRSTVGHSMPHILNEAFVLRLTRYAMPSTMSSRPKIPKYARNKNVLVVGGSGSGKTRFFIKPNLLQMHSSYVITDPKGSLIYETGMALYQSGYRIKVFNVINFSKSMRYNPFAYLHSEKDILKLVNTIMVNTKGEGEKSSEDFWTSATRSQTVKSLRTSNGFPLFGELVV